MSVLVFKSQSRHYQGLGLFRLLDKLSLGLEKSRQRRQLLEIDSRLLDDIGLTRQQVEAESSKGFWE